ncbi:MAG: choice-of-anchor D domain-containing protein, partial [candidate division WOR-3 bacterium]
PYTLAAGESLVVTVRFEPLSSGVKPCTIETGDALCSDVSCTGVGEDPPACAVTPTSIDFGTVTIGSSKDSIFTIKNTGGGTLGGSVSEACADYDLVSGGGPYTLAAGESLVVTVRFEPLSSGVKPCTIETGDALCSDVSCTGVGEDPPACAVTPTSIDFGTVTIGSSKDSTFTIKNTGGGTLGGTVSESCDDYDLISGGGPYTLAAGESLVVTVRFEPLSSGVKPCTIETGDTLCSDVSCTGVGETPTGVETDQPHVFALYQNHPNPFNPTTWIRFSLDRDSMVSLVIYDISGKRIRTLVNRRMTEGMYTEMWDARDNRGRPVVSGIYFYQLKSENRTLTRKLILLR